MQANERNCSRHCIADGSNDCAYDAPEVLDLGSGLNHHAKPGRSFRSSDG